MAKVRIILVAATARLSAPCAEDGYNLEFVDVLARCDTVTEQPELLTELSSISSVGFTAVSLLGLH